MMISRGGRSGPWCALLPLCAVLLTTPPARAVSAQEVRFERAYQRGLNHFRKGDYGGAVQELEAAYALRQMPTLMYNLGKAYWKLGNAEQALRCFQIYRDATPNLSAEFRVEVEDAIQKLNLLLERAKGIQTEPHLVMSAPLVQPAPLAPAPLAPAPLAPAPALSPDDKERLVLAPTPAPGRPLHKKWWFWTAIGGGTALLAGVIAGSVVASRSGDPCRSVTCF